MKARDLSIGKGDNAKDMTLYNEVEHDRCNVRQDEIQGLFRGLPSQGSCIESDASDDGLIGLTNLMRVCNSEMRDWTLGIRVEPPTRTISPA